MNTMENNKKTKVAKIILPGRPITKKNHQRIIRKGSGRSSLISSRHYLTYEEACLWELKKYEGQRFKDNKLQAKCLYWMPNYRSWPDLIGLLQATWDILEKADIIDNDQNIVSPDGSRIVGIDRENPRTEIFIRELKNHQYQEGGNH